MAEGSDDEMEVGDIDIVDYDEKIQEVKAELETNLDDMELTEKLMDLLKKNGDFEELHSLRTKTSEKSPLSAQQWISWTKDLIASGESRNLIESIFQKALFDHSSLHIWIEFVQWSIGLDDVNYSRDCFESALTAIGLRFDCGSLIWHAYLDLEEVLYSGSVNDTQKDRVLSIFKRALRIPTSGLDSIWERYIGFADDVVDEEFSQIYKKTKQACTDLIVLEKELDNTENSFDSFCAYLEHEMDSKDIGRIRSFFERIVEIHCSDENAWANYATWCEKTLKDYQFSCRVYQRAVRHCPFSAFLWQGLILAFERGAKTDEEIDGFWQLAIQSIDTAQTGRSLYRTYLYHLKRRATKGNQDYTKLCQTFEEGKKMLEEYFAAEWDSNGEYRQNYAHFEFSLGKNPDKAREIWRDILSSGGGRFADKWLEAVRCERQYGDSDNARGLLFKAVNSVSDSPTTIFEYFIQFEREEGTIETLDKALEKVNNQIELRSKRPHKKVDDPNKKFKHSDESSTPVTSDRKRPRSQVDVNSGTASKRSSRLAKQESFAHQSPPSPPKKVAKDKDGFAMPSLPIKPSSSSPPQKNGNTNDYVNEDKPHSVFISNLDFKVTPERIKEVLDGVVEVRFLYRGSSKLHKGYGFVDLASEKFVRSALAKDRIPVDGRPMFIALNNKDKRVTFKYDQGLEKAKVFVRNVHYDCTEEQLKDALSIFGEVKDVRLVTHKSGKAKGCAYVEFVSEESAAKAIHSEVPIILLERNLSIALSNPPKKSEATLADSQSTLLSEGARRAHLQIVPRSLNVRKTDVTSVTKPGGGAKPATNMSNNQFRQFFTK